MSFYGRNMKPRSVLEYRLVTNVIEDNLVCHFMRASIFIPRILRFDLSDLVLVYKSKHIQVS